MPDHNYLLIFQARLSCDEDLDQEDHSVLRDALEGILKDVAATQKIEVQASGFQLRGPLAKEQGS